MLLCLYSYCIRFIGGDGGIWLLVRCVYRGWFAGWALCEAVNYSVSATSACGCGLRYRVGVSVPVLAWACVWSGSVYTCS